MSLINKVKHEEVEVARFGKYKIADNTSAVIYRLGDTIIDTGPPNQWKQVRKYLSEISFKQIILTHHHEDHSGNGSRIAKDFNVPVYIHDTGIDCLQKGFPLRFYQKIIWGRPKTFTPQSMPQIIKTDCGHTLKPIHTPGHSPDHLCFLEQDRKWLFTGDSFLAIKQKLLRSDESLDCEIISLKKILEYDFNTIFCSHKGVVPDGYGLIEKKLEYFHSLISKVKKSNSKGMSVTEITQEMFGKKDSIGMISFKHLCYENLIKQCVKIDN